MELLCELIDFSTLSRAVALGVVHQATRATVIAAGRLMGAFVTSWTSAPDCCCSSSCGGGSSSQWLVIAVSLFLLVVLVLAAAATLDCSARIGLVTLPHLWGRWDVPGTALNGPGAFVHQVEELSDILDVIRDELLQHLLIPYSLTECNHNRSIRHTWDGVANLGKTAG
jgi:hypothetical protein